MYAEEAHATAHEHAHHVQRSIGREELRSSRLAALATFSDARTDAAGWGGMTVIDSSVADTILDSDVEMEPQAVADTLLDEDWATGGVQACERVRHRRW